MNKKKISIIALITIVFLVVGIGLNFVFSKTTKEKNIESTNITSIEEDVSENKSEKNKDENLDNKSDKEDKKENSSKNEKGSDEVEKDTSSSNKEENKEESSNTSNSNNNESVSTNKPQSSPNVQKPEKKTVTISISCKTAINNNLNKEPGFTHLPSSGTIISNTMVEIEDGDTVFDVLVKAVRKNNVHMEYTGSGSSVYIEGINNLYEFDGGSGSGWMYSVNGVYPNYGCGSYKVKNNDVIKWNYTCDLGKDLGASRN